MKRVPAFLVALGIVGFLASCGTSDNGELIGVQGRKPWFQSEPYQMVFVRSGVLQAGVSDQDVFFNLNNPKKTASIKAFYMDETEISNNEYRQFVYWVRDSIAHKILGNVKDNGAGGEQIDWEKKIDYSNTATTEQLSELFYPENEQLFGKMEMDSRKMIYEYAYHDFAEAAKKKNADRPRTDFVVRKQINIYPDTLVWVRDYAFSYNEPQTQNYFSHPAYDDYPVVGVSWEQCNAFCDWRTKLLNTYRRNKEMADMPPFRLPTEFEWEYAARAGKQNTPYPWGGPYIRNDKGCFLANFKPGRGNYADDGGFYTVKVYAYNPNDYGLYNMAGNVAEWTISAYEESIFSTVHDLNPDYKYNAREDEDKVMKRKVIKGGSWKDVAYMLQNGTRTYEYQDSAKSYIGFRCVMDFLGRSLEDFK